MLLTSKANFQPSLFRSNEGKVYIVPDWKEVPSTTSLKDIVWNKVKQKSKTSFKIKSSTSNVEYTIFKVGSKYQCNCPGYWRSKKRECKHIRNLRSSKDN